MRIGHGYDVHRFAESEVSPSEIVLGGVAISHDKSLLAHSDGDVLLHALMDALLGAIAAGDIGRHFPDDDPQYKNANSRDLLNQVKQYVQSAGFKVANIDATIIAQKPKLAEHIPEMQNNIADDLQLHTSQVNIKATTTEKLGFAGREEGIAVHAVCLLESCS